MREQVAQEDVGPVDEPAHELRTFGPVEGHGDRPLAAVVDLERVVDVDRTLGELRWSHHAAHDVAGQGLDLDHVGAHVGEHGGGTRRSHPVGDLDDPHISQR